MADSAAASGMKLYEVEINGTKTVLQMTAEDKDKRFPKTAKEVKGRSAQDIPGGVELGGSANQPPATPAK